MLVSTRHFKYKTPSFTDKKCPLGASTFLTMARSSAAVAAGQMAWCLPSVQSKAQQLGPRL